MNFKDLQKKTIKELHALLSSNREKLRVLKFSIGSNQEKNVRTIRTVKKTIAKILTLLNKEVEKTEKVEKVEKKIDPSMDSTNSPQVDSGPSEKDDVEKTINNKNID